MLKVNSILVSDLKLIIMWISETTTLEQLENVQIGDFLANDFNEGRVINIYSKNSASGEFKEFEFLIGWTECNGLRKTARIYASK